MMVIEWPELVAQKNIILKVNTYNKCCVRQYLYVIIVRYNYLRKA